MGKVVEKFRAGMFTVELDAGKPVLASMAGQATPEPDQNNDG